MQKQLHIEVLNSEIVISHEMKEYGWELSEISLPKAHKVEVTGVWEDEASIELYTKYSTESVHLKVPTDVLTKLLQAVVLHVNDDDAWWGSDDVRKQLRDRLLGTGNGEVKRGRGRPKKK